MAKLENEDDLDDECEDILDEEENELPKRCEKKYKEIENFKLYELTHCIAYEMAIRNNEVQKIIKEIEDLTRIQTLQISGLHYTTSIGCEPFKETEDLTQIQTLEMTGLNYEGADNITSIECKILNLYKTLEDEYYIVYNTKDVILSTSDEQFQYVNYYEPDDQFDTFQSDIMFYSNQENSNKHFKANCIVKDAYAVFQGGNIEGSEINVNKIVPNFKKSMRVFNQTQVALNLALPIEQIKAFIEIIKKDYDEENSSIQSFKQLLGLKSDEEAEKIMSLTQAEWADCFFIYDYYKASNDQKKTTTIQALQEYLTEYNGVKVKKSKEQRQRDKNKNDNKVYEIIPYQIYRKSNPIEFINNKPYDKLYDKDFKDHKPFYGDETIEDRLIMMQLLIDNLKYKTLILN